MASLWLSHRSRCRPQAIKQIIVCIIGIVLCICLIGFIVVIIAWVRARLTSCRTAISREERRAIVDELIAYIYAQVWSILTSLADYKKAPPAQ